MKKFFAFLLAFVQLGVITPVFAAITVKKSAPVEVKETDSLSSVSSLLPSVIGMIGTVQQLKAQEKELTEECLPSSQDVTFVNNMIKEWAASGSSSLSKKEVWDKLGRKSCVDFGSSYASSVSLMGEDKDAIICFDSFSDTADKNTIWEGYPKAAIASYCSDGSLSCSGSKKKQVTNLYDLFNLIDFETRDYTADEAARASAILSKVENCSYAKLSAKKKAMWGNMLNTTISTLGQPTNTGSIMEQVSGIVGNMGGSSGLGGTLNSLGGIATQFLGQ